MSEGKDLCRIDEVAVQSGMQLRGEPAHTAQTFEVPDRRILITKEEWSVLNRHLINYLQSVRACLAHTGSYNPELEQKINSVNRLLEELIELPRHMGQKNMSIPKFFKHDFVQVFNSISALALLEFPGAFDGGFRDKVEFALERILAYFQALRFWVEDEVLCASPVDLQRMFGKVGRSMNSIFCVRRNSVCKFQVPNTDLVLADESALWLLLDNIAKNATDRGFAHKLQVEVVACEGFVEISISDDGTGVADMFADNLFDYGVTNSNGGTGIGLGDAQQRMATMGGSIYCEAHGGLPSRYEDVDRGAKFVLRLQKV